MRIELADDKAGSDTGLAHDPIPQRSSDMLPERVFESIVAHTPLVAIDLLVEDRQQRMLLGWRRNPPARGYWFVPGGRIRKDEPLADAFARISQAELGQPYQLEQSIFMGVHQHFYADNFRGERGATTHYIALAHKLWSGEIDLPLPAAQHSSYRWAHPQDIAQDLLVHPYARAYFAS